MPLERQHTERIGRVDRTVTAVRAFLALRFSRVLVDLIFQYSVVNRAQRSCLPGTSLRPMARMNQIVRLLVILWWTKFQGCALRFYAVGL
jgi:hypothetical protein